MKNIQSSLPFVCATLVGCLALLGVAQLTYGAPPHRNATPCVCADAPTGEVDLAVDPLGLVGGPCATFPTLQEAVNAARDNASIGVFGNYAGHVVIGQKGKNARKDLLIVKCPGPGATITATDFTQSVFIIGPKAGKDDGDTGKGDADIHIEGISVVGTNLSGFEIDSALDGKVKLRNVSALDTTTGLVLGGDRNQILGWEFSGSQIGVDVLPGAERNTLNKNVMRDNSILGCQLAGERNVMEENTAQRNPTGFAISGDFNTFGARGRENVADDNFVDGMRITGAFNDINNSLARSNGAVGINVLGTSNFLADNHGSANGGSDFFIAPDNFDAGGNTDSLGPIGWDPALGGTFP